MAWKKVAGAAVKRPFTIGGLFLYLKKFIFVIWFLVLIIGIIQVAQEGGLSAVGQYIGNEILAPTLHIQETALEIIQQGGVYSPTENFFGGVWDMFKKYGNVLFDFIDLFVWFMIIKWFVVRLLTGDTSRITSNYLITIVIFYFVEVISILATTDLGWEALGIPIMAFKDFFRALPYLLPFNKTDNIKETINQSINNTILNSSHKSL